MRNAGMKDRWQQHLANGPNAEGIPAENLMISRPVRLLVETDGEGIVIRHYYRGLSGDARNGAVLALTRANAVALMARLAEVIQ